MKSETHFSREAVENEHDKVLKENSISGKNWSSAKLFTMQNYTENTKGNVPYQFEIYDIFSFFEIKLCTCSFFIKNFYSMTIM